MSETIIRPAAISDLGAIVEMLADDDLGQARESVQNPVDPRYVDAFEAIERDPNQLLVVAEIAGQIAGCLQLSLIPGLSRSGMWRGQIESVRIASSFRGRGLGRTMVVWAIDEAKKHGCGLVQLTSDKKRKDALRFYQSLGFVASHEGMKLVT